MCVWHVWVYGKSLYLDFENLSLSLSLSLDPKISIQFKFELIFFYQCETDATPTHTTAVLFFCVSFIIINFFCWCLRETHAEVDSLSLFCSFLLMTHIFNFCVVAFNLFVFCVCHVHIFLSQSVVNIFMMNIDYQKKRRKSWFLVLQVSVYFLQVPQIQLYSPIMYTSLFKDSCVNKFWPSIFAKKDWFKFFKQEREMEIFIFLIFKKISHFVYLINHFGKKNTLIEKRNRHSSFLFVSELKRPLFPN